METNQSSVYPGFTVQSIQERDEALWAIARKRASFKWSLTSYILVNSMLVAIWYLTSGADSYFWPVWSIIGWGFGVALHYFEAYHSHKVFSVQKEYEKLKNK
jgi:hypothetical protein